MYHQLGNIVFSGLVGPSSMVSAKSARLPELALLDGKSRLQKTGDELETLTLEIYLHAQFSDPARTITDLSAHMSDGSILPLIDGTGTVHGDFVINSISQATNILAPDGKVLAATLTMVLKEYIGEGSDVKASQNALKSAIAVSENGVVPVRNSVIAPSPIGIVNSNVTTMNSSGLAAVGMSELAATSPTQSAGLLQRAAQTIESVVQAAQKGIDKIQEVNSLAQKAPALLASIENVKANASLFKGYCENGDVTNALTQGRAMNDSLGSMNIAALPLTIQSITRR